MNHISLFISSSIFKIQTFFIKQNRMSQIFNDNDKL